MGVLAWLILFAYAAVMAMTVQYTFFRGDRKSNDYDWVYTAGGALLGAFTAHVWYAGFGPVVDGLNVLQALGGGIVGGAVVEAFYRLYLRRGPVA